MKTLRSGVVLALLTAPLAASGGDKVTCFFQPAWKDRGAQAEAISSALSQRSGVSVTARIAKSYPEILEAFEHGTPCLVYIGSFVQAVLRARALGTPMLQGVDGKESYGAVLLCPKGKNPEELLRTSPAEIAYTVAASSGESAAKAATRGKARLGVGSHGVAAAAVTDGKAAAAFVKSWWWKDHQGEFPGLAAHELPGISEARNPDNILTASKGVAPAVREKLFRAALASGKEFGVKTMEPFDGGKLDFSLDLMRRGGMDPRSYQWPQL
ncbi:MAG: PhnD/SsuA/transferrin family substrate-binding protein [Deltaproteobacteria bacterium]|nr:PhnD/SsuA/transferrin family substrate-binding protein [Deltaproteobacteria bacterium]